MKYNTTVNTLLKTATLESKDKNVESIINNAFSLGLQYAATLKRNQLLNLNHQIGLSK